jgi:hypothetical protein
MTSKLIALFGEDTNPLQEADEAQQHVATSSQLEIDWIVKILAEVAMRTQPMPVEDRRRVMCFIASLHSLLHATTTLDKTDQAKFESALRAAAKG